MMLSALGVYQWLLALVSLFPRRARTSAPSGARSRFVVLVPAHNEEDGLAVTLQSIQHADYPTSAVRTVVVADRCGDRTAERARACGVECLERRSGPPGKGAAIAWAVAELQRRGAEFDALVLIDADTIADSGMLAAFDDRLRAGHDVQQ